MRKIFHRTSSDRLSESITRLDIRWALASIHLRQAASVCVCSMFGSDEASLISFSCLLASKDTLAVFLSRIRQESTLSRQPYSPYTDVI